MKMRPVLYGCFILCVACLYAAGVQESENQYFGSSPNVGEGPPRLPPGTRGYLLQFAKASAPAVEPGQHVDVSVSYGSPDHRLNEMVARNALLMATGDGIGTYKGLVILTLAITPAEAAKLDRAKKRQRATISVEVTSSQTQ